MNMKPKDPVRIFVGQDSGPERYVAFFEDTAGDKETPPGGYLYVKDCEAGKIIKHLEIYQRPPEGVDENDVQILWSSDGTKCGVLIWGKMWGIVDIANSRQTSLPVQSRESPAITDPEWLNGFDDYLDQRQFIRARQGYWKEIAREFEPSVKPLPDDATTRLTNFILYATGPDDLFAVFEDDGKTGYLYVYGAAENRIIQHLLIYDRSDRVNVLFDDVCPAWSEDGTKCGVLIWGKMRGIVDRVRKQEGRVKLENRDTPGIGDQEWLRGFEYLML